MSFCQKCGKELPEGATACECQASQTNADAQAPENNGTPGFVKPIVSAPTAAAPVATNAPVGDTDDGEYLAAIKDCRIINILALLLLAGGIVSLLLINEWLAAVLFLVGEIFVLVPNTKVQKICKGKNPTANKKAQQAAVKETTKRLKSKDKNFKFSFIIAIVCLVGLVSSFIVPVPLLGQNQKQGGNDVVADEEQSQATDQTKSEQDKNSSEDESDSSASDSYAVDVIVGGYDYFLSTNSDATAQVSPSYPYASYLNFKEDGTGNMTLKTNSSGGVALYETTWEFAGYENNMRKYIVTLHTDEILYVYYGEKEDICLMYTAAAVNGYARVSGNAQDNVSGITTSTAYDVEGNSFNYVYSFDSATNKQITADTPPYVNSLVFGEGNMFFANVKMTDGSTDIELGTWEYKQTVDGVHFYAVDFDAGWSWEVMYDPETDMCMIIDKDGLLVCFERSA